MTESPRLRGAGEGTLRSRPVRRTPRSIAAVALCLSVLTLFPVSIQGVASASNPLPPGNRLTAAPPLRGAAAGQGPTGGPLSYHGGMLGVGVQDAPQKVYLVFWGNQWGNMSQSGRDMLFANDPVGAAPYMQDFIRGMGTNSETWDGVVTQYCQGVSAGAQTCGTDGQHAGYPTGGALAGVWYDNSGPEPVKARGEDIANEATAAAAHFGNTTEANNVNAQYVIASATGTSPDNFPSAGFCAWHDYTLDWSVGIGLPNGGVITPYGNLAFTNMPYVVRDKASLCGYGLVNPNNPLDGFSIVFGHEYAETVTDPAVARSWWGPGGEIGDMCAWVQNPPGNMTNVTFSTGTFAVQGLWSNDSKGCSTSHIVEGSGPGAPQNVHTTSVGNGGVSVAWSPPASSPTGPVTGYLVSAVPIYTDRIPRPSAGTVSVTLGGSVQSWGFTGLVEDCHQQYAVTVAAQNAAGTGPTVVTSSFRPSGNLTAGSPPPFVVILLDGISESKPGFTMDPYKPTASNEPSYCPESLDSWGNPIGYAGFKSAPKGPAEFFSKWNYFDPNDTGGGNVPMKSSNSTPRDLKSGNETHSFMLDAIAATGAMILPFSYNGAVLTRSGSSLLFTFPAYTACNSTPFPPGAGCFPTADLSIHKDVQTLALEITSIQSVWRNVPIVVIGHSQGGLIAFDAWQSGVLPGVTKLFSLDSPINGVCPLRFPVSNICLTVFGYPNYDIRYLLDPWYFGQDKASGNAFRFIGTWGDGVNVLNVGPFSGLPAYGTGDETLQHQLLVSGRNCVDARNNSDCPDQPNGPDHISECRIPGNGWVKDDQHFIVKFCPGNVDYFNRALGLSY